MMAIVIFISLIVYSGARSSTLVSISDTFLREMGSAIAKVLTHGQTLQTIFFMILGIGLVIGG